MDKLIINIKIISIKIIFIKDNRKKINIIK